MRLLVSVRDADEARSAMEGGADIIDAKEPSRGALGAVALPALHAIREAVANTRPLSAALGDADNDAAIADAAYRVAALGFAYVKIGFRGVRDAQRAHELLSAAVRGAAAARQGTQVIAVAYADAEHVDALAPRAIIDVAAHAGAHGVLLDTAVKAGGGLLELMTTSGIVQWVEAAHRASLLTALAGKLQGGDLRIVGAAGADVVGVRGAACDGGREGRVAVARVRALAAGIQGEREEHERLHRGRGTRARSDRTCEDASRHPSQESGCPTTTGHAIPSAFSFR